MSVRPWWRARVHRARHATLGRPAALKLIHRSVWADPGFRRRFRQECDALALCDHPHIIPVYDAGEADGRGYLALRLADGGNLAELLRDGPLPASRALALLGAIASALDAVHATGHVHRDVTPANILLDGEGGPWLGDFGLARRVDATITTGEGQLLGTAPYLAPEIINGDRATPAADRYALGAVAFHALTGRPPHLAPDLAGVLYAHLHHRPPSVRSLNPDLPAALDDAFAGVLERRAERRPPSAAALVDLLAGVVTGQELPIAHATLPLTGPGCRPSDPRIPAVGLPDGGGPHDATRAIRPRRRRGRRIAAALSILLIAGAAASATGYTLAADRLPFLGETVAPIPAATSVPTPDGGERAATPATADDLLPGLSPVDAVVATVSDARVVSLPGGLDILAVARRALADADHVVSPVDHNGRPIGQRASLPWGFFTNADQYGLMVVREPIGERALIVRGDGRAVRAYMDGLAATFGARIIPAA
ncbi:MAG TPA: serine/threonine-protein kinase [Miltoncostaeaceae bacterium]|nr:serine/threonine-protein kinase [Miltoncostaeaceae bacterium]